MKMNFSNRLLMISRKNLKNMVQVMKTVVEAVRKYEYANHCKTKLRKKHISNMKRNITVQTIVDLMHCTKNKERKGNN